MAMFFQRALICLVFAAVLGAATFARFHEHTVADPANTLGFKNFSTDNLGDEEVLPDGVRWRWAMGPRTAVRFDLDRDRALVLRLEFSSPIPGQRVGVLANGSRLAERDIPAAHRWPDERLGLDIPLRGRKGPNEIVLEFSRWNGHEGFFLSEKDRRSFAVNVFVLAFADGGETP